MGNGNDSILEAYLFETNSLLEQLDSLVLAAEEKDSFSEEDVNTIFRIRADNQVPFDNGCFGCGKRSYRSRL